jgi:hypothetical protein
MLHFYKEPSGDFLAVDMSEYAISRHSVNPEYAIREGRATALRGVVTSVCTTGISGAFLSTCQQVSRKDVPREWMDRF